MKEVYEIISRIDRALGDSVEADFNDYPAQWAIIETLQEAIREQTGSFQKIHGAMMVFPLEQYEGSF